MRRSQSGVFEAVPQRRPADTYDEFRDRFYYDVIEGLSRSPKTLPGKYVFDERGLQLYQQLLETVEHPYSRLERATLHELADALIPGRFDTLIELGPRSSETTRAVLRVSGAHAYVPVDPDPAVLASFENLASTHCKVDALRADCSRRLPNVAALRGRRLVWISEDTLSAVPPHEAVVWLARAALLAGNDGYLLVGVRQRTAAVARAYADSSGLAAAFNRNLLTRINREVGATFDVSRFRHEVIVGREPGRLEMRLVSDIRQRVEIAGCEVFFGRAESVCTHDSFTYEPYEFDALVRRAGLRTHASARADSRVGVHCLSLSRPSVENR